MERVNMTYMTCMERVNVCGSGMNANRNHQGGPGKGIDGESVESIFASVSSDGCISQCGSLFL